MAVQAGKDLLVKVDMTSDGQFETIAGLRAKRVSFNAETVDVTSLDSSGGSGVFRDAGTDERARQLFFNGLTPDFQVIIPDFGVVQGPFQVSALEYAGSLNGEATFELSLQSAGELVFTPDVVV